jgi:hypothetical protein
MAWFGVPLRRDRRGIALALVLWVLVIGAALLTLALFTAVQEQRASGAERRLQHGFADAEAGLATALDVWTPASLRLLLPGSFDSLAIGGTLDDDGRSWRGVLRRLSATLFLLEVAVDARPEDGAGPLRAQVRLGRLVETRAPTVAVSAALSVGGRAALGADTRVDGRDTIPPWRPDCPDSDSGVAGLAAGTATLATGSAVVGTPPVLFRAATDSTLAPQDSAVFDRLASRADVLLPGGTLTTLPATVGTACDVGDLENWGAPSDPLSPCWEYLPIIHVGGDLTLAAGEGQGILLVDGNLSVATSYRFYGIVLVRGRLSVSGSSSGAALIGAVAAGSVGTPSDPASGVTIRYSKCMISNALLSSGVLAPLPSRGWKQLY